MKGHILFLIFCSLLFKQEWHAVKMTTYKHEREQEQLTWIQTRVLPVYGNFLWHLIDEIIGLFSLSPIIWRPVHLFEWWNRQKDTVQKL